MHSRADAVSALAAEPFDVRPALAEPIEPGMPDLLAEAVHAARREQARTVGAAEAGAFRAEAEAEGVVVDG